MAESEDRLIIGDRAIDIARCFPITLGDWEDMDTAGLVAENGQDLNVARPGQIVDLVHIVLRKEAPDIQRTEVRAVPLMELAGIMERIREGIVASMAGDVVRPTTASE